MPTPEVIRRFYQSMAWKRVRKYKRGLAKGICERCGKAGWEVHHKIPLTEANVSNPEIALGLDNLELLCTSCHDAARTDGQETELRHDVMFDADGNLIPKTPPGPLHR